MQSIPDKYRYATEEGIAENNAQRKKIKNSDLNDLKPLEYDCGVDVTIGIGAIKTYGFYSHLMIGL